MIGLLWLWKIVEKLGTCLADKKGGSRAAALHTKPQGALSENICVEEVVAEFSVGVELFG